RVSRDIPRRPHGGALAILDPRRRHGLHPALPRRALDERRGRGRAARADPRGDRRRDLRHAPGQPDPAPLSASVSRRAQPRRDAAARHLRRLNAHYDTRLYAPFHRAFYERSEFANYGYREDSTTPAGRAAEALLDRLLGWLPDAPGPILDVGCGKGAS